MDGKRFDSRNKLYYKKRKIQMARKIGYNEAFQPIVSNRRKHRQELKRRKQSHVRPVAQNVQTLKFGSFNINGLDTEAGYIVDQLIETRGFDVSVF